MAYNICILKRHGQHSAILYEYIFACALCVCYKIDSEISCVLVEWHDDVVMIAMLITINELETIVICITWIWIVQNICFLYSFTANEACPVHPDRSHLWVPPSSARMINRFLDGPIAFAQWFDPSHVRHSPLPAIYNISTLLHTQYTPSSWLNQLCR